MKISNYSHNFEHSLSLIKSVLFISRSSLVLYFSTHKCKKFIIKWQHNLSLMIGKEPLWQLPREVALSEQLIWFMSGTAIQSAWLRFDRALPPFLTVVCLLTLLLIKLTIYSNSVCIIISKSIRNILIFVGRQKYSPRIPEGSQENGNTFADRIKMPIKPMTMTISVLQFYNRTYMQTACCTSIEPVLLPWELL